MKPSPARALRADSSALRSWRTLLALGAPLLVALDAPAQRGPDGFGYIAITSSEPGGPGFEFVDIRTSGLLVASGDDRSSINSGINAPVPLGKPFPFYGGLHAELVPSTNGFITTLLSDSGTDFGNDCPIPAGFGAGGARIYVLHDDLVGDVLYQYFAECPRQHDSGRTMGASVFLWNARHFGGAVFFLLEALLYDNGDIVYQYSTGNPERGSESTTGIQNDGATIGLNVVCNTANSVPDNFVVRLTRGTRDDLLQLAKASFTIDWAKHLDAIDADALSIDAVMQRSGLPADLGSATVSLRLNGARLLDGVQLDEKGRAASARGAGTTFKARLDSKSGRFTAQLKGLDLREATGLANTTEEGSTRLVIGLDVSGVGLLTPFSQGTFEAPFSTVQDKRTSGSFAAKTNLALSGLLRFVSFSAEEGIGLHSFTLKKSVLLGSAAGPIVLAGAPGASVRIAIGTADEILIPFDRIEAAGAGATSRFAFDPAAGPVQHLVAFEIDNSRRTLTFVVEALENTGVPLAGPGQPTTFDLDVVIDCATAIGTVRLQTAIQLRRSSENATSWIF